MLRTVTQRGIYCIRWAVCEFLPLPWSSGSSQIVSMACRLVGCAAALGILSVELEASAGSHGAVLAMLWAGSAVTAVLIGNVAREWTFAFCSSVATWMGHAFHRKGFTLDGLSFLEIHYPSMTWVRCEYAADELSCEWTEPTGRCNRIEVLLRPPAIRILTAPRTGSG